MRRLLAGLVLALGWVLILLLVVAVGAVFAGLLWWVWTADLVGLRVAATGLLCAIAIVLVANQT